MYFRTKNVLFILIFGTFRFADYIVIINGVVKDFFKTEADVIKEFGGIINLANEINSPICKT